MFIIHTGFLPQAGSVSRQFSALESAFSMTLRSTNLFLVILFATVGSLVLLVYSFLWQEEVGVASALLQDENPFRTINTNQPLLNTVRLQKRPSTVLLATLWFNVQWLPSTSELLSCPVHDGVSGSNLTVSCNVTSDMSLFSSSDAVVFHAWDDIRSSVRRLTSLQRLANQHWVMFMMEPPLRTDPRKLSYLDSYGPVNWTATYMKNSDVQTAYYKVLPGVYHGGFDPAQNYLEGKIGMATILANNCARHRMKWIKKIQQYIDIKVYGKCGSECSRTNIQKCMSKLRKYKFYLSFENSYCRDYISEKIISRAFANDIIPVVISYVDFNDTSLIPPKSAINALEFPSVKELTNYMKAVGSNSTLYNEYFKWHSHYKPIQYSNLRSSFLCPLCRHIATDRSTKTYRSVHEWYSSKTLCKGYPVPV